MVWLFSGDDLGVVGRRTLFALHHLPGLGVRVTEGLAQFFGAIGDPPGRGNRLGGILVGQAVGGSAWWLPGGPIAGGGGRGAIVDGDRQMGSRGTRPSDGGAARERIEQIDRGGAMGQEL